MDSLSPTIPKNREKEINRSFHSKDRADKIEWSKFSTEDMREFLRAMGSDNVMSMFERLMGPEERHEFAERMGRFAKEGIQARAKFDALLEEAKMSAESEIVIASALAKVGGALPSRKPPVTPNVTSYVAPRDVTVKTAQNRHIVTVITPEVTPTVAPSSVVVRTKKGGDGLYHCRECNYVTHRAGTLRMHRLRKHPKNRM